MLSLWVLAGLSFSLSLSIYGDNFELSLDVIKIRCGKRI